MYESTGVMPSADRPTDSVNSYASVHDSLAAKNKSYLDKYQQFVINYVLEWEKVVTGRVNNGLKVTEDLRRDLDHYQKKVEALRLSTNKALANGKQVKSDTAEKLKRNEEKLIAAKQGYNKAATDLCILMEEVTERSWRDLHPLLLKCAQFDMTIASDESNILASLNAVVNTLKTIANNNGISPQPRLKDLATVKPELLSTRPGGVAALTIEAGPNIGSPTSSNSAVTSPVTGDPFAAPPGTLAPQGLGGFPITVANNALPSPPGDQYPSRSSSLGSFSATPPPPSLGALTLGSSAPPPTMDDFYSSNLTGSSHHRSTGSLAIQSAPNSGNLPPLAPPSFRPMSSFNDMDNLSAYSGHNSTYSAVSAAPVGAPPPPSMPPPPPPAPTSFAPDPPSYPQQQQWSQTSYADPPAASPFSVPPPAPPMNAYRPPPPGTHPPNPFG